MRECKGEGLGHEWPSFNLRSRMRRLENVRNSLAKRAEEKKNHLKKLKPLEEPSTAKQRLEHELKVAQSAVEAEEERMKKASRNVVPRYGCSRCRWSPKWGTGCDSANCNPHKYLLKIKKLLAEGAYDTAKRTKRFKEIFAKGLTGGGST